MSHAVYDGVKFSRRNQVLIFGSQLGFWKVCVPPLLILFMFFSLTVVNFLNLVTGAHENHEEFWKNEVSGFRNMKAFSLLCLKFFALFDKRA